MKPIEMIVNDVKVALEARPFAKVLGVGADDLTGALLRMRHDQGVTDATSLTTWIGDLLGLAGIYDVLDNLQLEFSPNDPKEALLKKWFTYRGVGDIPQPRARPNELIENLTEIAHQIATTPAKLDAPRLTQVPLFSFLRYMALFYSRELPQYSWPATSENGIQMTERLENLSFDELCELLHCGTPVRMRPYDPTSKQTIILSDETVCSSLSRLADLIQEASTLSSDQSSEFSDCLLGVLQAWHGDQPCTPKACTVAEVKETSFESIVTCYDELGDMIVLNGVESSLTYGTDVLVRVSDEGSVWAPEPQMVPRADAWQTPDAGTQKGRAIKMARDQVFISYSHADARWLKELQIHLEPYIRNAAIEVWDDTKIDAGAIWRESIRQALETAKVAVLLVSPNFLASKFIAEEELPPLLEAAKSEGVTILWVPVRSSAFEATPIQAYQAAHPPQSPVADLARAARDKAFVKICKLIQEEYAR
jgi:hypothetical protein